MNEDPMIGKALTETLSRHASDFACIALENITRPYPNQPAHVVCSVSDLLPHQSLHPAFYGSYDWHSAVHMHWLLARLLRLFPEIPEASQICKIFDLHFTEANIATEAAYFHEPAYRSFERTYGWAWLLKLQAELIAAEPAHATAGWRQTLQPLADTLAQRYLDFLPLTQFPIRSGSHGNSAFGLFFALEYARAVNHLPLEDLVTAKAVQWFGADRQYPAAYEPGGDDFLSGGLMEAALMRHVLDEHSFAQWWQNFCPDQESLRTWLSPVSVSDRSDPKLVHLDGLNLSRAWCWRMIAQAIPESLLPSVYIAFDTHLAASLPHVAQGDYASTHWLASFALLAVSPP